MYIPATKYTYVISADQEPVATIDAPKQITVQTLDASTNRVKNASNIEYIPVTEVNPATGPVCIKNAGSGDTLAVKILDIRVADMPHIKLWPGLGICQTNVRSPITKVCRINNGMIEFSPSIRLPVQPMIGVIATGPAMGSFPTVSGGNYGGNLDNKLLIPGTTIYLPVFSDGGHLFVGDLHASMGDGELCGLALEASGEVDLQIDVLRGRELRVPVGESDDTIFACCFYSSCEEAIEKLSWEFASFLRNRFRLTLEDAVMLISAAADFRFSQCAPDSGGVSARLEIDKRVLAVKESESLL
ncbi:MAG: acetamidase/formamidase family protein [Spirochaetaceae bacterium]|nr:MAG: acetamidase/formamidase family protein [Spirochaetaceae bacterium]